MVKLDYTTNFHNPSYSRSGLKAQSPEDEEERKKDDKRKGVIIMGALLETLCNCTVRLIKDS